MSHRTPSYSTVFHVAPRRHRELIAAEGIDHSCCERDWRAGDPDYGDAPFGNYVWDSPDDAFFWSDVSEHLGTSDVWEVAVDPYEWIPDPHSGAAFYTTATIRPQDIRRVTADEFFQISNA